MTRLLFFFLAAALCSAQESAADLSRQVSELRDLVLKLQTRIDDLERRSAPPALPAAREAPKEVVIAATTPAPSPPAPSAAAELWQDTTINFTVDGYYAYNFNSPIGRTNLLRAYDVSSNSFSLNQADLIIENAADASAGKHWGARLDLQFGQATQTLQGNAANEPRPEIYRNVFQAYGTWAPNTHLTVDFGKWSSSIGLEGNYSKDQINYSRSFWFDFLPFYHMGVRAAYKVNSALTLNYWLDNGTQQTEAFNGFKDELFGFALQPRKTVSWTVNYYLGQEHPDVVYYPYTSPPGLPTNQGVSFSPIVNPPKGKTHIFDSYATWTPTDRWTLAAEADDVIQRDEVNSAPFHTVGGALYARYQLTPKFALAARGEYLSDHGGLYTGVWQQLKEVTLTTEYKVAAGFIARIEWRRDVSNYPYFLTDTLNLLGKHQTTATMGVIWWFGKKTGSW
ncbi:MAG TPA: outer membrane beta-barrel protein [Bryobacteraceae bacterium]|nr:outer membrane beta-barrel protein [Bryobacteraceae bacterium]